MDYLGLKQPCLGNFTMLMFRYSSLLWLCIILASLMSIISACTAHMSGKAKDGSTWWGETRQLEGAGAAYTGPQYTIGIVRFDNKAPATVSGAGEAAAAILGTQLEAAGLEAILLDENALREAEKFKALQRTGVVNTGNKDTGSGFDALDYRLSGAIAAYSEVEEQIDTTFSRKKYIVARVTVDYAFSDITTGRSLMVASGAGEYRKIATGALGLDTKSSFDPDLRDGALHDALAKVTGKVIRKLGSMPFQGRLLAVDGTSLVLKAGRRSWLKEGTQLAVYRVNKVLVDPDNGQVLGYKESKVGVIQISDHRDENLSSATIVSGNGFKAGDVVKPIP